MSMYSLCRFWWWRQWRNGGTRLLLKSLAWGLVAAYVGLFVGWIGLVFPETVAGSEVQRAPIRLLHDHLLSVFAGLLVVRGVLQRFIERDWRPVLGLLPSVGYGQFAFAWHGGHFDGLLARASPTKIVRATLIVLGGLAVGPLLLATPVVSWEDPFFALPMAAFALYHAGVTCPVVVWTGVLWNRRRVNPVQSRFSFSGGSVRIIVLMALLSVPPALFAVFGGLNAVLVGVAGLGGLGLGAASLWLPRLGAVLHHRRHAMLRGFRRGGLSPSEWYW